MWLLALPLLKGRIAACAPNSLLAVVLSKAAPGLLVRSSFDMTVYPCLLPKWGTEKEGGMEKGWGLGG